MLIRLLILICFFSVASGKVVIFDLHNVLVDKSRKGVINSIGFGSIFSYYIGDFWRCSSLKPLLYKTLNTLGTQAESEKLYDSDNQELPAIMVDWLKGTQNSTEILQQVSGQIDILGEQSFFVSKREKKVMQRMISCIFDPQLFAEDVYIIEKGHKLVEACSEEKHTLVILSNWDADSFYYVKSKFKDFFACFDYIFISGEMGAAKPEQAIFKQVLACLESEGYRASDCYFIDDQFVNVSASIKAGLNGLWLKNGDYGDLKNQMRRHKLCR